MVIDTLKGDKNMRVKMKGDEREREATAESGASVSQGLIHYARKQRSMVLATQIYMGCGLEYNPVE